MNYFFQFPDLLCLTATIALVMERYDDVKMKDPDIDGPSKEGSDEFAVSWTAQEGKKVRNKLDWQIVGRSTIRELEKC